MKTTTGAEPGTYTVQFVRRSPMARGAALPGPTGPLPRVTRLLVLAHKINGMIRSGEIRDWADAARLTGVTRARMTQIASLLLLAPEIQTTILELCEGSERHDPATEHRLRAIVAHADWTQQRATAQLERRP